MKGANIKGAICKSSVKYTEHVGRLQIAHQCKFAL
jgi:hypothetical protein